MRFCSHPLSTHLIPLPYTGGFKNSNARRPSVFSGNGASSGMQLSLRSVAWVDQQERLRSSGGARVSVGASGQHGAALKLLQSSHVGTFSVDKSLLSVRSVLRGSATWTAQQQKDFQSRNNSAIPSLLSQPHAIQPQLLSQTQTQRQHLFQPGLISQHEVQAQVLGSLQMHASRPAPFFQQHSNSSGVANSQSNISIVSTPSHGPGSMIFAAPEPDPSRRPSSQSQNRGERERQSADQQAAALNRGSLGRSFELYSHNSAGREIIDGSLINAPVSFLDDNKARLQPPVAARLAALRQSPLAANQGYSSSVSAASHANIPDRSASSRVRGYSPGPGRIRERMQMVEGMNSATHAISQTNQQSIYGGPTSSHIHPRPASSVGPASLSSAAPQQHQILQHDAGLMQKTTFGQPQVLSQSVQHQQLHQGYAPSASQRSVGDHFQPAGTSVASGLRLPQLAQSSSAARSR